MDEVLRDELESSLIRLVRLAPSLDDLLVPRQASSGENSGKPPTRGKSKPPVDMTFLDFKIETFNLVNDCCCRLRSDFPEVEPLESPRDIVDCAQWLLNYLDVFVAKPWAERYAEQVISQVSVISDVISPPLSLKDPVPQEVGTARVIVRWARYLGREVTRSTIQRWIASGVIESDARPDGSVLIRLTDVLQAADMREC